MLAIAVRPSVLKEISEGFAGEKSKDRSLQQFLQECGSSCVGSAHGGLRRLPLVLMAKTPYRQTAGFKWLNAAGK
ncbi:hypothetical protein [Pseudomonas umsongensis]|uniref:hypothetical protein n=1 Tax=Pseudomonas umsongensis TaxID=198618 RepID=UPI0015C0682D|nr:hypothetical protein [Pseudomonas umsongensis]